MSKKYDKITLSKGIFDLSLNQAKELSEKLIRYAYQFTNSEPVNIEFMEDEERAQSFLNSILTVTGIEGLIFALSTAEMKAKQEELDDYCSMAAYETYGEIFDKLIEDCRTKTAGNYDRVMDHYIQFEFTDMDTRYMGNENVERDIWDYGEDYIDLFSKKFKGHTIYSAMKNKYGSRLMQLRIKLPEKLKEDYVFSDSDKKEIKISRWDGGEDVITLLENSKPTLSMGI